MTPETALRLARQRSAKAADLRLMRGMGTRLPNATIRQLVGLTHAEVIARPEGQTLGDTWPVKRMGDVLFTSHGDAEYWTNVYLLAGDWSDEDICEKLRIYSGSGGPGRPFSHMPHVERNGHSTIVRQSGGLDI